MEPSSKIDCDDDTNGHRLELLLQTDPLWLEFFNAFLAVNAFPQRLFYNRQEKRFEEFLKRVVSSDHSTTVLDAAVGTVTRNENDAKRLANIKYSITTLPHSQGIKWITKHRLPLFMHSEFFTDYKLAKALASAQVEHLHQILGRSCKQEKCNNTEDTAMPILPNSKRSQKRKLTRKISCKIVFDAESYHRTMSSKFDPSVSLGTVQDDSSITSSGCKDEDVMLLEKRILNSKTSSLYDAVAELGAESKVDAMTNYGGIGVVSLSDESESYTKLTSLDYEKELLSGEVQGLNNHNRLHGDLGLQNDAGREQEIVKSHTTPASDVKTHMMQRQQPQAAGIDAPSDLLSLCVVSLPSVDDAACVVGLKKRHSVALSMFSRSITDSSSFKYGSKDIPGFSEWLRKLDLSTKFGLDCFKMFVLGTSGETCIKLWTDVEQLKGAGEESLQVQMNKIQEKYFPNGAAFEISPDLKREMKTALSSVLTHTQSIERQDLLIKTVIKYWSIRYTLHVQEQLARCVRHSDDARFHDNQGIPRSIDAVRQRPHSSLPFLRSSKKQGIVFSTLSGITGEDGSVTQKKLRSKSAYARIITTPNTQETNAGYEQLRLLTMTSLEGNGFHVPSLSSYRHSATEESPAYVEGFRLFIEPMPPAHCKASVTKRDGLSCLSPQQPISGVCDVLDVLLYEPFSGHFFKRFILTSRNKLWEHCIDCWTDVQAYVLCYQSTNFNPQIVKRKAHTIFATYVAFSSKKSVAVSQEIAVKITKQIEPPYEDLFDALDLHVTSILTSAWEELKADELLGYNKLDKTAVYKYVNIERSVRLRAACDNDLEKDDAATDSAPKNQEEGLTDGKISTRMVGRKWRSPDDGVTFETLLKDNDTMNLFTTYLEESHFRGFKDYCAWQDMEKFRKCPTSEDPVLKSKYAKSIRQKWMNSTYFFGDDSPASKAGQKQIMALCDDEVECEEDLPALLPASAILKAQQYVRARLELYFLPLFKSTTQYQQQLKSKTPMESVVDEIMAKKKMQKNEHAWKQTMNSKWVADSKEAIELRNVLSSADADHLFNRYILLKGENVEKDIDFYNEIQKYKNFCHDHVEELMMKKKIQAMMDVFIRSSIPPELQVDIPIEIGERLYDRACGRVPNHGPYLFRDAQAAVFQSLLPHWKEYKDFCLQIGEDNTNIPKEIESRVSRQSSVQRTRKLTLERRRLMKLTTEKRRKVRESCSKGRQQDMMSVVSENATTTSAEYQMEARPFAYSKLIGEIDLRNLEVQMLHEGMELESFAENKSIRHNRHRNRIPSFSRQQSTLSERSVDSRQTFLTESSSSRPNTTSMPLMQLPNQVLPVRHTKLGASRSQQQASRTTTTAASMPFLIDRLNANVGKSGRVVVRSNRTSTPELPLKRSDTAVKETTTSSVSAMQQSSGDKRTQAVRTHRQQRPRAKDQIWCKRRQTQDAIIGNAQKTANVTVIVL